MLSLRGDGCVTSEKWVYFCGASDNAKITNSLSIGPANTRPGPIRDPIPKNSRKNKPSSNDANYFKVDKDNQVVNDEYTCRKSWSVIRIYFFSNHLLKLFFCLNTG